MLVRWVRAPVRRRCGGGVIAFPGCERECLAGEERYLGLVGVVGRHERGFSGEAPADPLRPLAPHTSSAGHFSLIVSRIEYVGSGLDDVVDDEVGGGVVRSPRGADRAGDRMCV